MIIRRQGSHCHLQILPCHLPNGLISQSNTETDTYILFATDGHGDVTKLLDATNPNLYDPVDENEFDAFGNGGSTGYSAMGYAGQYHDYETGFIYLRARYYSPAVGRFINEDSHWTIVNMVYGDSPTSIGGRVIPNYNAIVQSTNLYGYCANNPINRFDYNGESFFGTVLVTIGVGVVGGLVDGLITGITYLSTNRIFLQASLMVLRLVLYLQSEERLVR